MVRLIPISLLAGCSDPSVVLQGTVYASADPTSPALGGAEVTLVDAATERIGSVKTDAEGAFEIVVPEPGVVFVEITAPDYAVSTFPGIIGAGPVQVVEEGALYGVSEAERAEALATFAGCPGADGASAIVVGEMRLHIIDTLTGGSPTTGTGVAEVLKSGESTWTGCYLDGEGVYDPEAVFTGLTGKFLVGGVQPGLYDLAVSAEIATGIWTEAAYPLWIPDRPHVVSPWYPAWLPLD